MESSLTATYPIPKQDLAIGFWQGDWDTYLGMVTDLQRSHSVDVFAVRDK